MTKLLKGLFAAGLTVAALAGATTTEAGDLKGAVPFRFVVNGRTLPAGVYDVTITQGVIQVRGMHGGAFVISNHAESAGDTRSRLVFYRIGDEYVLREAWAGATGRVVPGPRPELTRRGDAAASVARVEVPLS